jgi:hypothetical protein
VADAPGGGLLEQREDQLVELGRHAARQRRGNRRRRVQVLPEHVCGGHAGKGLAAGDELEEDAAQRVEVRARVDQLAADLLGGRVGGSAGEAALHVEDLAALALGEGQGQPEVHEHRKSCELRAASCEPSSGSRLPARRPPLAARRSPLGSGRSAA